MYTFTYIYTCMLAYIKIHVRLPIDPNPIYMYICIYTHTHTHTYIYIHVYIYICYIWLYAACPMDPTPIYIYVYIYIYLYDTIYGSTLLCLPMDPNPDSALNISRKVQICVHVYTYIYIYNNTYICICIYLCMYIGGTLSAHWAQPRVRAQRGSRAYVHGRLPILRAGSLRLLAFVICLYSLLLKGPLSHEFTIWNMIIDMRK